jgi:uncharacterized protein with gpF-like domain
LIRAIARSVREQIGLTPRQAQWVENYRAELERGSRRALGRELRDRRFDPSVRRAIERGEALDDARINRMVDRYRERFTRYRSEVIARTEALRSVHEGTNEMYQQAIEEGALRADQIVRTWNATQDERTRDSHSTMHGQEVGPDEAFETPTGQLLMYPGDPTAPPSETVQCRCVVTTRLRGL